MAISQSECKSCKLCPPIARGASLCRIEASQTAQARLLFQFEVPFARPIAAQNVVQLSLHPTRNYDIRTYFYASFPQQREARGARGREALDHRAQHMLARRRKRQAGKGGGLLFDARPLAREIRLAMNTWFARAGWQPRKRPLISPNPEVR